MVEFLKAVSGKVLRRGSPYVLCGWFLWELVKDRIVSRTNSAIDNALGEPVGRFLTALLASPYAVPLTLAVLIFGWMAVVWQRESRSSPARSRSTVPMEVKPAASTLALPATPPPPPERQPPVLTAYDVEIRLKIIDEAIAFVRDRMHRTEKDGPSFASGWLNGLADKVNHPNFGGELVAFRNGIQHDLTDLEEFRVKNKFFQAVVIAVQPTYWNKVLPPVEAMLIAFLFMESVWKPDIRRDYVDVIMKPYREAFEQANQTFSNWRSATLNNLMDMRRDLSP